MTVISKKDFKLSPEKTLRSKTPILKRTNNSTRGRSKVPVSPNKKHHSPHPTRCLRGVSTRATFKRSPSPRKDWPFDEAILYPPHPKVASPRNHSKNKSHNSPKKRITSPHITSKHIQSPLIHSSKSVKTLRNVSTRSNIKTSYSPKNNLLNHVKLSPQYHSKNKSLTISDTKKNSNKKNSINESSKKSPIKKINIKSPKIQKKNVKIRKINKKTPIKQSPKKKGERIEYEYLEKKPKINFVNDRLKNEYDFCTESIATVQDGEEDFVPSPITTTHIGWGGTLLKKTCWNKNFSGYNLVKMSHPILWNEIHSGSMIWKPHKCINNYRLVTYSREHFNPYSNSSILQVAEYIWELNNEKLNYINNSRFPALFELLFIRKESFLTSVLNRFYSSSMSYDSIFREMMTQSLFRDHNNIVKINEVIVDNKFPYSIFVMEYLPHSSMFWNDETQSYEAPSLNRNIKNVKKVYTSQGSKLIFREVVKAIDFLHKKGIFGIYIRPESVKMSHSLDETFIDENGDTLTRIINDNKSYLLNQKNLKYKNSKFGINEELSKYWENVQSINIFNQNDKSTISYIHNMISEKEILSSTLKENLFLFNPELINNTENLEINNNSIKKNHLFVKLNFIFKGMSSNFKESLFTGNKWLLPPELYFGMFNKSNYEVDFKKCDIWNLGILLHCFLTGRIPNFVNNDIILDQNIPFELKKILSSMLKSNPNQRITINEILNSNWLME